jgi:hypothetical protein
MALCVDRKLALMMFGGCFGLQVAFDLPMMLAHDLRETDAQQVDLFGL